MRNISRFAAILILMALTFSLGSCFGYDEDVTKRINTYLAKEYPGREFAIIDYEKHNETSGRYEINMRCLDDGVEFMMFMYSSIAVTDSYSVERANLMMSEIVGDEISKELAEKFENITWHDIFADRATNYRFREIAVAESFSLADFTTVNEIKLAEGLREEEIGEVIYNFIYDLCGANEEICKINRAEFVFKINRITYHFTTDSRAILNLGADGVIYFIVTNIETNPSALRDINLEYLSAEATE